MIAGFKLLQLKAKPIILTSVFLIYTSLFCFGQRKIIIGLQGGASWGSLNEYSTDRGNIWVERHGPLIAPKMGAYVDLPIRRNFYLQVGVDLITFKSKISGWNMSNKVYVDEDGIFEDKGDEYFKYNYATTEVLILKYMRIPIYATYHLHINSNFKLIYGLGAAYGYLLTMENKVLDGPQLISNRKFRKYDFVISAFHMAELSISRQFGLRIGLYFDQGIVNIDNNTRQGNFKDANVLSQYFGGTAGITYNISKLKE